MTKIAVAFLVGAIGTALTFIQSILVAGWQVIGT